MGVVNEGVKYRISLEDLFSQGINNAERNAMQFESTVSGLQSKIAGIFAGYQGINFAKSVIDTGAGFEAAEVGLSTLLKSADQAHQVFKNIQQDAARTPFDVQSLLLANRSLISAGVSADQARKDVLNLANAIAASGGGADELSRMVVNLQQIKNTGKATGIDIKQFAYAGVNVYGLLADSLGKTTEEVQGMEVSYEMLTAALAKAHAAGGIYEGGLEKMMKTTQGQISNLSDLYSMMKNEIFKSQQENINSMIQSLAKLIQFVKENINAIMGLTKAIVLSIVAFKAIQGVIALIRGLALAYRELKVFIDLATAAESTFAGVMAITPWGAIAAGIGIVITAFLALKGHADDTRAAINKIKEDSASAQSQAERDLIETLVDARLMQAKKAGKVIDEAKAREEVISQEAKRYKEYTYSEGPNKGQKFYVDLQGAFSIDAATARAKTISDISADMRRQKLRTGSASTVTPSKADESLSEPKASKIQNVTITFNGDFFRNMTNTYATMEQGVDDFMSKLAKALNGVVTDATILARE